MREGYNFNKGESFNNSNRVIYHSKNNILKDIDNLKTLARFYIIQVIPLSCNAIKLRLIDNILDKREEILKKKLTI